MYESQNLRLHRSRVHTDHTRLDPAEIAPNLRDMKYTVLHSCVQKRCVQDKSSIGVTLLVVQNILHHRQHRNDLLWWYIPKHKHDIHFCWEETLYRPHKRHNDFD